MRDRADRKDQGFLYFCLDDCSAPADSYQAAAEVVEELEEKGVSSMDFSSGCGSTCFELCAKLDDPDGDGITRFVEQRQDTSVDELEELSRVTKEEVEECIRTMWNSLFDIEASAFVMTCPEDKVEEYAEDFRYVGFDVEIRDYESVLKSSFNSRVCCAQSLCFFWLSEGDDGP